MVKLIYFTLLCLVFPLAGCQNEFGDGAEPNDNQKEYILSKVNNYQGLIKLYHDKLNRKGDAATRYKLADLYYQVEDYESSRYYLHPLLITSPDEKALLLESKNLLEQGKNDEGLSVISRVLDISHNNGDAHNIRGIFLARTGDFSAAQHEFNKARLHFVDDGIVLNNMAMLAIMQEDYITAKNYMMPLYARGHISQKMLHNLVFVLVKMQNFQEAENILRSDKMYDQRDGLLESLSQIKPRSQKQLLQKALQDMEQVNAETDISQTEITPELKLAVNTQVAMMSETGKTSKSPALISPSLLKKGTTQGIAIAATNHPLFEKQAPLRKVSAIRASQHMTHFRITIESAYAINYQKVSSTNKKNCIFYLYNIKPDTNMLSFGGETAQKNKNIEKMRFYQNDKTITVMEIDFRKDITNAVIFRLPKGKSTQERLVFDIYHEQ